MSERSNNIRLNKDVDLEVYNLKKRVINLNEPAASPKEQDIGSINAFYGKASELVERTYKKDLQGKERAFQQATICSSFTTLLRLMTIRDGVVISHSPVGCSGYLNAQPQLFQYVPREGRPDLEYYKVPDLDFHWLSTNLSENDVIFGGAQKLGETIKLADERYKPKSIFVTTSCASGIIGDDIEGLIREVQPETNATIVPIRCEATRSRIWQSGYDSIWHAILKYLVKEPEKKQEDLVNIPCSISFTWLDRQEITRLLGKIGLKPNFVPELSTTEQLEQLSEAALTATVCGSFSNYLGYGLEQEYGVPYFNSPAPMGLANTDNWLRKIGEIVGKEEEVEKLIEEERAAVAPTLEALREGFKGKKAKILDWGGQARGLGLPLLTHEIGLKVSGVGLFEYDELVPEVVEDLAEQLGDFDVHVANVQPFELEQFFDEHKPDIYTTCPFVGANYKRPSAAIRHHSFRGDDKLTAPQYGYLGFISYGSFLLRAYQHHTLNKTLGAHVKRPYKESVYQQKVPLLHLEGNK